MAPKKAININTSVGIKSSMIFVNLKNPNKALFTKKPLK